MTKTLAKGTWYTVTTASTCTITDANGTSLGTAEAGKQFLFQATTEQITFSDDSATVLVNPKLAPAKLMTLGLLGGGVNNALPAGYLAAEFIFVNTKKTTGVPIFNVSPDTPEPKLEVVVRMPTYTPTSANFITSDTTQFALAIYAAWSKSVRWQYGGAFEYGGNLEFDKKYKLNKVGRYNYINGELVYTNVKTEITTTQTVMLVSQTEPYFYLYSLKSDNTKDEKHEYIPALTPEGSPSLYDKVTQTTHVLTYPVGFTLAQARKLCKLPATGGSLTISLPTGYESDAGVLNALETARGNGWTLTVQTYEPEDATASASTYALRRVWVRRTQDENGTYVAADGTRWLVDWCVDMLTPDGSTPDAHGYELYRSTEAAVEYWGLEPWVDPEADRINEQ